MTEAFVDSGVPGVLPEVTIPSKYNPDNANVYIVDTEAGEDEVPCDSIVLVYDAENRESFSRLTSYWLPLLSGKYNIPIILAGNKIDKRGKEMINTDLEAQILPLMNEFRNVETCIECSAKALVNVAEVFYFAVKSVIHPSSPLYDPVENTLKPKCLAALTRIFRHCDLDNDGFISDSELNEFQLRCFKHPLKQDEISGVKESIKMNFPEGVSECGISEIGFLHLNKLFIQRGRLETTWSILRTFGYNDDLDFRTPEINLSADSTLEFTSFGISQLVGLFDRFSVEGCLSEKKLEEMFRLTVDATVPWYPQFPANILLNEHGII